MIQHVFCTKTTLWVTSKLFDLFCLYLCDQLEKICNRIDPFISSYVEVTTCMIHESMALINRLHFLHVMNVYNHKLLNFMKGLHIWLEGH